MFSSKWSEGVKKDFNCRWMNQTSLSKVSPVIRWSSGAVSMLFKTTNPPTTLDFLFWRFTPSSAPRAQKGTIDFLSYKDTGEERNDEAVSISRHFCRTDTLFSEVSNRVSWRLASSTKSKCELEIIKIKCKFNGNFCWMGGQIDF